MRPALLLPQSYLSGRWRFGAAPLSTKDALLKLTAERLRELLDYDETTGVFTWRSRRGQCSAGAKAGTLTERGYIRIEVDGRSYRANRLAWLYVTGEHPTLDVDHEDRNRANNAFRNLRHIGRGLNLQNRVICRAASGLIGAYLRPNGTWFSSIMASGKTRRLGTYSTAEAAHAAYMAAKRELHPSFSHNRQP